VSAGCSDYSVATRTRGQRATFPFVVRFSLITLLARLSPASGHNGTMQCDSAWLKSVAKFAVMMATVCAFASLVAPLLAGEGESLSRSRGKHWAYISPERAPLPEVQRPDWCRQPLDRFIADQIAAVGLQPSSEADRIALIRRVTFDLTGLPPTPDEVEAFLASDSPDAYERLVDRLLASPRYGERMAVEWLDLARYADTHGYHSDGQRQMWRWRDWVVDALNANMPFDQFTLEQIAGDLIPNATLEQQLATGFHRNHMLNDENGAIPEEYLAEYVAERASTTATVWLGQTLACARCHDHKHDPFTQREFFQFYAFFNNIPENGLGGRNGNAPPTLSVPTHQQRLDLDQIAATLRDIQQRMATHRASQHVDRDLYRWEKEIAGNAASLNQPPSDSALHLRLDEIHGEKAINAADSDLPASIRGKAAWIAGKFGNALLCDGETYAEVNLPVADDAADAFTLSAWIYPTTTDTLPILSRLDETQYRRGFEWGLDKKGLYFRLSHAAGMNELVVHSRTSLRLNRWQHVALTYDGSSSPAGVKMFVDGKRTDVDVVHQSLTGHIATDQLLHIGRGDSTTFFRGMLDEIRVFSRSLAADEVARLAGGDPIREVALLPRARRTAAQQSELRNYYLENVDAPYVALMGEQRRLDRRRAEIERIAPSAMVLAEMKTPRPTHVHLAGRYDLQGEQVTADAPRTILPLATDVPSNRLGLAKWLIDARNPLTARVAANRQWQILCGTGLVRTPDDFGLLGERPSHPQLLDWLAIELRDSGWDVKRLQRMLVTSATYRQSSSATDDLLAQDPHNRLLARSPRQRLSAEMLRDAALQSAGLLQLSMGGPSVKPYQPAELWTELAYNPKEYSAQVFEQSHGEGLYRRSLYTFWKRSVPPPNLALLDAPDREVCTVARPITESSLQSLVLLNDTTFVEAARLLAERAMKGIDDDPAKRIDFIFRHVLARPAAKAEKALLLDFWRRQSERYERDPTAATKLLGVGETLPRQGLNPSQLAAWTSVVSAVLNLDEAVTK
jgi:hypothetical protein